MARPPTARGVPSTVAWLAEELGRTRRLCARELVSNRHEFGDVFAWLCITANQMDIDPRDDAMQRYVENPP